MEFSKEKKSPFSVFILIRGITFETPILKYQKCHRKELFKLRNSRNPIGLCDNYEFSGRKDISSEKRIFINSSMIFVFY